MGAASSTRNAPKPLPVDSSFKFPSPLPFWPQGEGFGQGSIDLQGLQVCQVSTFNKIWTTREGGPDDLGATFFEPSSIPQGFSMLGCYAQPNNRMLFGWVLAGKDNTGDTLKDPVDYVLIWRSDSLKIKQDGGGYFWQPVPPDGYKAVGLVVTNNVEKPPLDKIRCVRTDLTDECEADLLIWGSSGLNVSTVRPTSRGIHAPGVCVGTFIAQSQNASAPPLACLKNVKLDSSYMPNIPQIEALFRAYSPWMYLHPDEKYLPSSVSWYFTSGALLYKKGEELEPVSVEADGSNLPQGGSNDGLYWLDLPQDKNAKEKTKKGNLESAEVYLHVKPMLGGTFTDIATWVFYPFNGPGRAKVKSINIPLGKIGQHVGDWEHVTLRVSNFNGELWRVFLSQHSGGTWVDAADLEFQGGNKPVTYASLSGHAVYPKPGLVLQGKDGIGIRNDTAKSKMVLDTGGRFSVVSAEYMNEAVVEPKWLNYFRHWGPNIEYDYEDEVKGVEKLLLVGSLKTAFRDFIKKLPKEVFGEEGPTGPKLKRSWTGDEK